MAWRPLELCWGPTFMDALPAFGTWSTNKKQSAGTGKVFLRLQHLSGAVSYQSPPASYSLTSEGAGQISLCQYVCNQARLGMGLSSQVAGKT